MTDLYNPQSQSAAPSIPYSQEAEEATIGAVLINPDSYYGLAAFLKEDDFYLLRHRLIWQALDRMAGRSQPIDYLTLVQELRDLNALNDIGGPAYLTQLINNTGTSVHAETYGRIVEGAATRRRLIAAADQIKSVAGMQDLTVQEVIAQSEAKLFDVTERQLTRELIPMREAMSMYYERIEQLMYNKDGALGVPSGFKDLDKLLGGLQKSDLLLFAGRPGMGKCVAAGTLVPTERGLVPIESLKPEGVAGIPDADGGVYYPLEIGVQTPTGLGHTAYFYDSGLRETRTLTTQSGHTLTATLNHPLLRLHRSGRQEWTPLDELRAGDWIALQPGADGEFRWDAVKRVKPGVIQPCYDLTLPEGHAFVTNGIVSHNTSFMLSAAVNMARLGARIAIFSMEMGIDQIVQRLVSMEAAINSQSLRLGQLTQQEWSRFVQVAGNMSNFRIFIDDTAALNPMQLRTKCLRMAREHGVDLVVVDYIQLMNSGGVYENNRVQEISYISRSMKELARELNVPVLSAAQLSRAVEQRQDKRPQLSDLRESGCLAGESLVYLPDEGRQVPIRDLVGKTGFRVTSLNTETWKLEPGIVTNAFCTGVKPVYRLTTQLGRSIRATGNHKFLTITGWKRLDELTEADHIALPRHLDGPTDQTLTDAELALLGHLIGDGCTLPRHTLQYTTRECDLAETVAALATEVFGDEVAPRIQWEGGENGRNGWYQVYLPTTRQITHGVRNPISAWLTELGVFGLRSYEKFIPEKVFQQPAAAIALFLRHLWATDGSIGPRKLATKHESFYPNIYYATSSERLARDIEALLLRLGINITLNRVSQKGKGRDQFHCQITGRQEVLTFLDEIGTVGAYRLGRAQEVADFMQGRGTSTKRDYIPNDVWMEYILPAANHQQMNIRKVIADAGLARHSTEIWVTKAIGRDTATRLGELVSSESLKHLGVSDVYWDRITSIESDGEVDVYDLTVEKNHDFICNSILLSNSLEQDADIVMFLYRDEVYNEATEFPNQAEIIIAKHRNGPTGTINLYFEKTLTRFMNAAERSVDLSHL
jgi:replicative DNA helicase